ncbi:Guanine nucleotide-binding protein-like 3 [Nymphon striatum]|nr:Guanine nucleotide-binding protein-like 3 [Nymphon striatum]
MIFIIKFYISGKKSKRMTCRMRYKIEKKVKDHNKKLKKVAKKNPNKAKKKDPGVPNSLPFKEEILQEAERKKQQQTLADLKNNAEKRNDEFNEISALKDIKSHPGLNNNSKKTFYKEFRKVVEDSDVILQVLDARDPLGCRCTQVEKAILESGSNKRLVFVLNKIDLIPKENLEKWLTHLRREFPTVAFKASTQSQKQNLGRSKVPVKNISAKISSSNVCIGADLLVKLLANYCRNKDIRTAISVGVVGFPNVGKSSLINSLKRSRACNVGAMPGLTKSVQTVTLDKHIKLFDSPGIIMASGQQDDAAIALKNAIKVETIEDPIPAAKVVFQRASTDQLMMHYNIQEFSTFEEFLTLISIKRGMLKKGGIPDINKAAKTVIMDWNFGRIKYYTHPPENNEKASHVSAKVVSEMSKEFDIEALLSEEKESLKDLKFVNEVEAMVLESSGPTDGVEEEEAMVTDEPKVTVTVNSKRKKKKGAEEEKPVEADNILKANTLRKKAFKKMVKKRNRSGRATQNQKGKVVRRTKIIPFYMFGLLYCILNILLLVEFESGSLDIT